MWQKLHRDLARANLSGQPWRGALYLADPDWPQRLGQLLQAWSSLEAAELLAAPVDRDDRDPGWAAQPIQLLLQRLETPWFPRVLAQDALVPYFQPIVSLHRGEVCGYEALIRANCDGHVVGAGSLIGAARAHQSLRAFDQAARSSIIRKATPQIGRDRWLFINFTPSAVYDPATCLATTWRACQQAGADLSQIVFEVIENESFPDISLLERILAAYRSQGARVALDDLGAGYTSLSYLMALKPDVVRLDRELIQDLTRQDPRAQLVSSLLRFARECGIRTVAEGIETAEELHLLRELGAD